MPTQNPYVEKARQLTLKFLEKYPVKIYLFGSRAVDNPRPDSDIDIAILSKEAMPKQVLVELKSLLEESNIPYEVDLVNLSDVDQKFRDKVLHEGIVWKD